MYVEGMKFELDSVGSGKGLVMVLCKQGRAFWACWFHTYPWNY